MNRFSRRRVLVSLSALAVVSGTRAWAQASRSASAAPGRLHPPMARIEPVTDTYFGVPVVDDYRWMETFPRTAEWDGWLKGQADYARQVLDALPQRTAMVTALQGYANGFDFVSVRPAGSRLFLTRLEPGAAASRTFVVDAEGAAERLLFDPAVERRVDGPPVSLEWSVPSPDGRLLAMGIAEGGSEISAVWIMDVDTGVRTLITPIRSPKAAWNADGTRLFYFRLREDAVSGAQDYELRGSTWMHRVGTDPSSDVVVLGPGQGEGFVEQEDDTPIVFGAAGSDWLVGIHLLNGTYQSQIFVCRSADIEAGRGTWRKVSDRADGGIDCRLMGDGLYVLANGRQSVGEVVRIDLNAGETFSSGQVVLAASDAVIDTLVAARDGLYVHTILNVQGGIVRIRPDATLDRLVLPTTGAIYAVAASPLVDGAWYGSDDPTGGGQTFHIDGVRFEAKQVVLERGPPFDTTRYVTESLDIKARDGVGVPVQIIRRSDLARDGQRPTLIQAYGAYGSILDPGFDPLTLAFLDAGGIIVYAHVRGGGEKGEAWHQAGMKATKPNTWRDAIDTALSLVDMGWTAPAHLAIEGTSAGGIMVGRAITERPDLFAAAIGNVGVFDAIRFELTPNGRGNDAEFGTVRIEQEFHGLLAMDSIQAVQPGVRYPAVLLTTGANDRRVEPWVVGKFAATLQAKSTHPDAAILSVNYEGGHFGGDLDARTAKQADAYAFVLAQTSIQPG